LAQVAQSVEQGIENPRVGGSIPSLGTTNTEKPQVIITLGFFIARDLTLPPRIDKLHLRDRQQRPGDNPGIGVLLSRVNGLAASETLC
jgi:hypothetical protein